MILDAKTWTWRYSIEKLLKQNAHEMHSSIYYDLLCSCTQPSLWDFVLRIATWTRPLSIICDGWMSSNVPVCEHLYALLKCSSISPLLSVRSTYHSFIVVYLCQRETWLQGLSSSHSKRRFRRLISKVVIFMVHTDCHLCTNQPPRGRIVLIIAVRYWTFGSNGMWPSFANKKIKEVDICHHYSLGLQKDAFVIVIDILLIKKS